MVDDLVVRKEFVQAFFGYQCLVLLFQLHDMVIDERRFENGFKPLILDD